MKLKMSEDGKFAVISDGKPVYVTDNGEEIAFDAPGTRATISRLNAEARGHREAKEAAETALARFAGIEDPDAAKRALETVAGLDAKKLIDAGEAERVRTEAIKATEAKWAPVKKERDDLKAALHSEIVGGAFARSKFIAEKLAIPADMAQAFFGRHFAVKDGRLVATDGAGNAVLSQARPGEMADFDEALSIFVNAYPQRDTILKGSGGSGGGAQGNGGGGGARTLTRAQFDALDPAKKMDFSRDVGAGKATLTD